MRPTLYATVSVQISNNGSSAHFHRCILRARKWNQGGSLHPVISLYFALVSKWDKNTNSLFHNICFLECSIWSRFPWVSRRLEAEMITAALRDVRISQNYLGNICNWLQVNAKDIIIGCGPTYQYRSTRTDEEVFNHGIQDIDYSIINSTYAGG